MKRPYFLFITIILLTIVALIIVLPPEIKIQFSFSHFVSKPIVVNQTIPLWNKPVTVGPLKVAPIEFRRGLDLEGGTSITLRADMKDIKKDQRDNALESAKNVIERRINFFGVSEPIVQTSKTNNDYRIIVDIPGITDVKQAVQLVGTTAKLEFWEQSKNASASANINAPGVPLYAEVFLGSNPKKTNLSGGDLQRADVIFDPKTGRPTVQLQFNPDGAKKFADITRRNTGKRLGFSLDNVMIDAPVVEGEIPNGTGVISGSFTTEQAKSLQLQFNAGALPISLSVLEQRAINATLGEKSLQQSLVAGIIGFIVIVVFMCSMYGRLGFIASLALGVYTVILLAIFKLVPITLTLAGIAGLILSIGIAVDANILIFERMREEVRRGKSMSTATQIGFSRAWLSIRDSNIASIITSILLFMFGNGMVKGFAVTLGIGVILSMFSAILVTRTFLRMFYKEKYV